MTIYSPSESRTPFSGQGNRVVFVDKATVTAALAIGDKVRPVRIPAGTKVDRVVVVNGDLDSGTTLTDKIGFEYVDGSSGPSDEAVCASGATTRRAAVVSPGTVYELFPPVQLDRDAYLVLTCVAAATGLAATVTVQAKVEGEAMGVK